MSEITASVSDSGDAITIETGGGSIILPPDELMKLVTLASRAAGHALRKRTGEKQAKIVMPVQNWRCTPYPDPHQFVLDLQISDDLIASYSFHKDRIPLLIQALQKIQAATPGSTSRN